MIRNTIDTIGYFTSRMVWYGLVLGLIFGSFTYPIFGSAIGTMWGGAVGLLFGIGTGIGVSVYNRFFVKVETDDETYQRDLSYGVGLVTMVVSAIPLLVIFAPVAAMTAAHVAHTYAHKQPVQGEKRKNEDREVFHEGSVTIVQVFSRILRKSPIFVILTAICGALLHTLYLATNIWSLTPTELITQSIIMTIGILIYGFVLMTVVGLTNGMFVHFLNQLHFKPDMPKTDYKRQIVLLVTLLTLLMTIVAAGFFGAPLAAIAAGWGANAYVDWYYEGQEKAKRHTLYSQNQLSEEIEEDDAILSKEASYLISLNHNKNLRR